MQTHSGQISVPVIKVYRLSRFDCIPLTKCEAYLQESGSITYNGEDLHGGTFVPARTAAYIEQVSQSVGQSPLFFLFQTALAARAPWPTMV